ncbi:MAG: hypothetical protein HFH48_01730 [Lachnospiraceae bacterium]|nr:hypothetical protein [Lachnospiraceae bacterium]
MKKKYAVTGAAVAAAAVILGIIIWAMPLLQTAMMFRGVKDYQEFQYEISMELSEKNLSEEEKGLIEVISWCLGAEEGMSWRVAGRVQGDDVYAELCGEGAEAPVTEIYLCQGKSAVNVEMLYETIRQNIQNLHPLLGRVLPEWKYGAFLSSAQIEEIFQVDLNELLQMELLTENQTPSWRQGIRALSGMKRGKGAHGERQFETEMEDYRLLLEFQREENIPSIDVLASDRTKEQKIAEYSGKVSFEETEEILFPEEFLKDEDVRQFAKLWSRIQTLVQGAF